MDQDLGRPARRTRIVVLGLSVLLVVVVAVAVTHRHRTSTTSVGPNDRHLEHGQLGPATKVQPLPQRRRIRSARGGGVHGHAGELRDHLRDHAQRPASPTTTAPRCATFEAPRRGDGAGHSAVCRAGAPLDSSVRGRAVVNTNPRRMVAGANIGGGNMNVAVRVDDTHVWEDLGGAAGLVPAAGRGGTATSLPGFASLTESALGRRNGAIAMLAMASPNGYLELESAAIDGAKRAGTTTVDGTPATVYDVGIDLAKMAAHAGLSTAEHQAISDALGVLHQEGYAWTQAKVSVDAAGYIRHMVAVHHFADKGTVSFDVGVSDIGCAGVVVVPGEQAPPATSSACISPDDPSHATTTSVAAVPTTARSVPSTPPPTEPPGSSTTTTVPVPTTTVASTTTVPASSTPTQTVAPGSGSS